MKPTTVLLLAACAALSFSSGDSEKYKTLSLGEQVPKQELKMKDPSGKEFALTDLKKGKGLLVIFSCNTCPFVIAWEDRYPLLGELCSKTEVGMVLINSNEARRSGDDSMEEMKKHAREKKYNTPYLLDSNSELANAFGARTTPHVFLFDKDLKLVYKGAIDDKSGEAAQVKEHYLKNAIENLTSGSSINPAETKAVGCSIKRVMQ